MLLTTTILIFVPYAILILALLWGWHRNGSAFGAFKSPAPQTKLSVIVAFRNEASRIHPLLSCLAGQHYPNDRMEVLLVNDHSEDSSAEAASHWAAGQSFEAKVLHNAGDEKGKKEALTRGIQEATGELIVTTDADCAMGPGWLSSIARYYEQNPADMIAGPVLFEYDQQRFFEKFQALEFLTLLATTAGSIGAGRPLFCNAANMAFRRTSFLKLNDPFFSQTVSGDDTMLLQKIKAAKSSTIAFNPDRQAVVTTPPEKNLRAFWNQRKRWVSKSRHYNDRDITGAGLIVFLANMWLMILILGAPLSHTFLVLTGATFAFKALIDLLLLRPVVGYFAKKELWKIYLPAQIVYPIYSTLTGIWGRSSGFTWKSRHHHVN